jgi:hypothetical protein
MIACHSLSSSCFLVPPSSYSPESFGCSWHEIATDL